jgi:UDP-N-acetylglucosamine 2-epimerase (non-hydrolysing)
MNKPILCIVGTRPEVIKMAPVVTALRDRGLDARILATAQHRGLLDQAMAVFGLRADWDLDLMRPDQTLPELTGRMLPRLDQVLAEAAPTAVLAQGDTTTVFCAALAAFYRNLPFGHVEAGLRSGDLRAPFPEEANRRLCSVLTRWHFAPTGGAREALVREGVAPEAVAVVGNTVIDALLGMAGRDDLPWPALAPLAPGQRLVLVTLHRRENFGAPLERILATLRGFHTAHPEARMIYPVHPNPNVAGLARRVLGGLPGVDLVEPQDYPCLVRLLKEAYLVITDSGGIQEEAPALGKPVLVCREVTERPEAVAAGGVRLVGSDPELLSREAERLWNDPAAYRAMAAPRFPYGDGQAARRIAGILGRDLP